MNEKKQKRPESQVFETTTEINTELTRIIGDPNSSKTRVRITTPNRTLTGTIRSTGTPGRIILEDKNGHTTTVFYSQIDKLKV